MVKKVKGIKVGKELQDKFKFTSDGQSQIGTDDADTHSLLGETNIANDTTVDGQLYFQQRIADALFGAPQLSGTFDEVRLQEMADNAAAKYEGFIFYLTGESTVQPFLLPQKFYFCEDGAWHPSPFVKEVATQPATDTDGDGVVDTLDTYPNDPFLTFTPTRQHRFYFYGLSAPSGVDISDVGQYATKNLTSANGLLQHSRYPKLATWANPSSNGGYPAGDGTYNYSQNFSGHATTWNSYGKYTEFDTKPDDNVYTMDVDLTSDQLAGSGINVIIGNTDISADPENTWHYQGGARTDQNLNGYVWFRPYPEMIDELDGSGNPTGLKTFSYGGRLKIQLKHALDDKIYIRIAHGATEANIDIDAMPWIDSDIIDADHDRRPIPYDQFPTDGSDWVDHDSDGLGYNAEVSQTTYHTAGNQWYEISGSILMRPIGDYYRNRYTIRTDPYAADTDGDGTTDGSDLFPNDSRRAQDSHGLHLGLLHEPDNFFGNTDSSYIRIIDMSAPNNALSYLKREHPASWDTIDAEWDALGTGFLDTNPYYKPPTSQLHYGRNALSQSLGFGEYMTFDLNATASYKFDMIHGTAYPADDVVENSFYLVGYSGSLAAAKIQNQLFTNNPVSASAMNSYYQWKFNDGVNHNGAEFIDFDTAVNGRFAADPNLHLLTDYTGKTDFAMTGKHPMPNGPYDPRHSFYLHTYGNGTYIMIADMFHSETSNNGNTSNTFLQKYDALGDLMFEQDMSGDLILKENPSQENGTYDFELDTQGDIQLTA